MIKPHEIPSEAQRVTLAAAEKALDQYLMDHYQHKPLYVSHPNVNGMTMDLWRLLHEKYRRNGWEVKYRPSGMDEMPEGPYFSVPGAMGQLPRPEGRGL